VKALGTFVKYALLGGVVVLVIELVQLYMNFHHAGGI